LFRLESSARLIAFSLSRYSPPLLSPALGVGHEPEPLSEVRGADPRSAEIKRPDGVARSFQVRENSVEPPETIRARNLLSKHDWRAALRDELKPRWPKVARIGGCVAFPRC
jgi:hypothetical protein